MNTADVLVEGLERWGVDVVFGLPGDGINGLMEAFRRRRDRIRFVLVRHEEAAALAAVGYAKLTGRLGVCVATSGPGGIHLLNGLYDAKLDGQPVLALTGTTYSDLVGSRYQQEVDLTRLFSDVAAYNVQVSGPEHAAAVIDHACRAALTHLAVAHLTVPVDVQEEPCHEDFSRAHVPGHTAPRSPDARVRPPAATVRAAAEILNAARRPVVMCGQGARFAAAELLAVAERLQAPVVKALLGKDVVADTHPLCLGGNGLLGTAPSVEAMRGADALLLVGTSFPYMAYLPEPGQARVVQVDVDPFRVGLRTPVDVGVVGDAQAALADLLPLLEPRGASEWLAGLQGSMREWRALLEDRASREASPMRPQLVARELAWRLRDDAIVTCDSGTIATWAARYVDVRGRMRFTLSGNLASMAVGLPYAIGAQAAFPDRQVVAFVGDGGLLMLASELSTAAQHGLPVKVVVVDNGVLGMIKWEQMVFLGNPSYAVDLPRVDFVKLAESLGVRAFRWDRPQDAGVLDEALAHDGPALVQAVVDPNEPPWPPDLKVEQGLRMAQALARGEPNAARIGLTLFRDVVGDLTARGGAREDPARPRRT